MRDLALLRHILVLGAAVVGLVASLPRPAVAVACASGVYRAGCVGPRGAIAVRRGVYGPRRVVVRRGVYAPRTVVYRRGYRRW
jgi:hypothetical protein